MADKKDELQALKMHERYLRGAVFDDAAEIVMRLRDMAEKVEHIAGEAKTHDESNLASMGFDIMHELTWLTPNLPTERMLKRIVNHDDAVQMMRDKRIELKQG